jgi:uncharacterized protein (TIGR04255 family)
VPFPAADHVTYADNPLDNVICQVRFPTILRIDAEPPLAMQERLLPDYIHFKESQAVLFNIKMAGKPIASGDDLGEMPASATKAYEFSTDDKRWTISLTRNFLSLSTPDYQNWGEFRSRFETALSVLLEVYKPAVITRVGLRYIDVIVRSRLRLDHTDWGELIAKPIVGVLASDIKDNVDEIQSTFSVDLKDQVGAVKVRAGTVKAPQSDEICFMIDSDYFNLSSRKPEEILPTIDVFHSKAYNLFRWCISDQLHNAMRLQEE